MCAYEINWRALRIFQQMIFGQEAGFIQWAVVEGTAVDIGALVTQLSAIAWRSNILVFYVFAANGCQEWELIVVVQSILWKY